MKMKTSFEVLFCVVSFQWTLIIQPTDQCVAVGNGNGLPSFTDYSDGGNGRIPRFHQAIIPSYRFHCCGNVTEWRVNLHPASTEDQWMYTLNLQVWRPSSTTADAPLGTGYYTLVGNERVAPVSLTDGRLLVTSTPGQNAQFRPGDVLGFNVENARDSDRGVVVITTAEFSSEMVWHASVTSNEGNCNPSTYLLGNNGDLDTLTRAAPVISMSTITYNCPPIAPTLPPCPSQLQTSIISTSLSNVPSATKSFGLPSNSECSTSSAEPLMVTINSAAPLTVSVTDSAASHHEPCISPSIDMTNDSRSRVQSSFTTLIIGAAVSFAAAIIIIVIVAVMLVSVAVWMKTKKQDKESNGTLSAANCNRANGIAFQDKAARVYAIPELAAHDIKMKQNKAYATSIVTNRNVAYIANNVTEKN